MAKRHMKRCSSLLIIVGKNEPGGSVGRESACNAEELGFISSGEDPLEIKTMRYHLTLVRRAIIKRSTNKGKKEKKKVLQTIDAEEGVEKMEPSYTVGRNVNWCSHYGEQYGGSLKK